MTYERFKEIWTTLVTNRPPASTDGISAALPLNNGVSEDTVNSLVAAADGDFASFDSIEEKLVSIDSRA